MRLPLSARPWIKAGAKKTCCWQYSPFLRSSAFSRKTRSYFFLARCCRMFLEFSGIFPSAFSAGPTFHLQFCKHKDRASRFLSGQDQIAVPETLSNLVRLAQHQNQRIALLSLRLLPGKPRDLFAVRYCMHHVAMS